MSIIKAGLMENLMIRIDEDEGIQTDGIRDEDDNGGTAAGDVVP